MHTVTTGSSDYECNLFTQRFIIDSVDYWICWSLGSRSHGQFLDCHGHSVHQKADSMMLARGQNLAVCG